MIQVADTALYCMPLVKVIYFSPVIKMVQQYLFYHQGLCLVVWFDVFRTDIGSQYIGGQSPHQRVSVLWSSIGKNSYRQGLFGLSGLFTWIHIYTSFFWEVVITRPCPSFKGGLVSEVKVGMSNYPDSKVYGANMGPTWVLSTQMGPMLAPWTLLSGGRLNKKDGLTRYGNSHVKDKTS